MLKLCFNLAHSMFDDGYSPRMRNGEETFGYKTDDISFCFVIYSSIIASFFFSVCSVLTGWEWAKVTGGKMWYVCVVCTILPLFCKDSWTVFENMNKWWKMLKKKKRLLENTMFSHFPGGMVGKNLPANAGHLGSIPDPGRPYMPRSNWAPEPWLLRPRSRAWEPQLLPEPLLWGKESHSKSRKRQQSSPLPTRESPREARKATKIQCSQKKISLKNPQISCSLRSFVLMTYLTYFSLTPPSSLFTWLISSSVNSSFPGIVFLSLFPYQL